MVKPVIAASLALLLCNAWRIHIDMGSMRVPTLTMTMVINRSIRLSEVDVMTSWSYVGSSGGLFQLPEWMGMEYTWAIQQVAVKESSLSGLRRRDPVRVQDSSACLPILLRYHGCSANCAHSWGLVCRP